MLLLFMIDYQPILDFLISYWMNIVIIILTVIIVIILIRKMTRYMGGRKVRSYYVDDSTDVMIDERIKDLKKGLK